MNRKIGAIYLFLLVLLAPLPRGALAADSAVPATLAQALEGAELDTKDGWAFRQTQRVAAMDEPAVVTVTRWDPSKPAGKQCTVVSIEVKGAVGSKDDVDDPCEEGHERDVYGALVPMLNDAVIETVSEDDALAVYRITPRDKKRGFHMGGMHIDVDDEDLEGLQGTLRVIKTGEGAPYVERLDFHLSEAAGNLLAKLSRLEVTLHYAPDAATGVKLMTGMSLDLQLRLFTLIKISTRVSTQYDEFRRLQ